jgi:hypothetical protein
MLDIFLLISTVDAGKYLSFWKYLQKLHKRECMGASGLIHYWPATGKKFTTCM